MRPRNPTIAAARRLRREATDVERKLWRHLCQPPFKSWHFRRQVPLADAIVDFASHRARLVVELDGGQHATAPGRGRDMLRDARLAAHGYRVLRIWNNEVVENLEGVLERLSVELETGDADAKETNL